MWTSGHTVLSVLLAVALVTRAESKDKRRNEKRGLQIAATNKINRGDGGDSNGAVFHPNILRHSYTNGGGGKQLVPAVGLGDSPASLLFGAREVPLLPAARLAQPVSVTVHRPVPVAVPQPYPVSVPRPYPVAVPQPVTVHVPRPVPVPVAVPHPVGVPVPKPYPVPVPHPVPVPVFLGSPSAPDIGLSAFSQLHSYGSTLPIHFPASGPFGFVHNKHQNALAAQPAISLPPPPPPPPALHSPSASPPAESPPGPSAHEFQYGPTNKG